jgi:hypothetical protein
MVVKNRQNVFLILLQSEFDVVLLLQKLCL